MRESSAPIVAAAPLDITVMVAAGAQQTVTARFMPMRPGKHALPFVHVGVPRSSSVAGTVNNYFVPVTEAQSFPSIYVADSQ
jgi:hypothetical protein